MLCYKNHGVWQYHPHLASREKSVCGHGCLVPAGVSAQHRLQRTAASPLVGMRREPAKVLVGEGVLPAPPLPLKPTVMPLHSTNGAER